MLLTLVVVAAMIVVGVIVAALAGPIWKGHRPIGLRGDMLAAILTSVVVGLLDWFVIPAMGMSDSLRWIALALEPAGSALLVLWIIRRTRR